MRRGRRVQRVREPRLRAFVRERGGWAVRREALQEGGGGDEGPFFLGSEELWGVGWGYSR